MTGETWEWELPEDEGGGITDVHSLPFGLAAELDNGVVALDGATGEEIWHYRRPDATVVSASATSDGELFALAFQQVTEESDGDEQDTREEDEPVMWAVVILDAVTGEITNEYEIEQERKLGFDRQPVVGPPGSDFDAPATGVHHLTDDARLVHAIGPARVEARALDDDEVLWSNEEVFAGPVQTDADGRTYLGQVRVVGDTVLASQFYTTNEDHRFYYYDLTAIDSANGEVRWRKSWELGDIRGQDDPTFSAPSPEGGVAVWLPIEDSGVLLDLRFGEELASDLWADGRVLGVLADGYVTADGPSHVYRDRSGEPVDELQVLVEEGGSALSASIATPEAVIGLYAVSGTGDTGSEEQAEDAAVRVFSRDGGAQTASIPLDVALARGAGEAATRLSERVAEQPRFLRAVPGAVVVLDQGQEEGGESVSRRIIGLT
ncbi:hypothetical protein [Nocardiopsis sp. YSL2]|uniref:hypothetical protein n=1 Tax=Nocardiopsis sp. YSL2 TaxID=2939492 RepID=UPI0026F44B7E|nr:hypothetical protein [Nocardiopsis sp. YSL2]